MNGSIMHNRANRYSPLVLFWMFNTHLSMSSTASHIMLSLSQSQISMQFECLSPFPFTHKFKSPNGKPKVFVKITNV